MRVSDPRMPDKPPPPPATHPPQLDRLEHLCYTSHQSPCARPPVLPQGSAGQACGMQPRPRHVTNMSACTASAGQERAVPVPGPLGKNVRCRQRRRRTPSGSLPTLYAMEACAAPANLPESPQLNPKKPKNKYRGTRPPGQSRSLTNQLLAPQRLSDPGTPQRAFEDSETSPEANPCCRPQPAGLCR
jgi:hypothetical protein